MLRQVSRQGDGLDGSVLSENENQLLAQACQEGPGQKEICFIF